MFGPDGRVASGVGGRALKKEQGQFGLWIRACPPRRTCPSAISAVLALRPGISFGMLGACCRFCQRFIHVYPAAPILPACFSFSLGSQEPSRSAWSGGLSAGCSLIRRGARGRRTIESRRCGLPWAAERLASRLARTWRYSWRPAPPSSAGGRAPSRPRVVGGPVPCSSNATLRVPGPRDPNPGSDWNPGGRRAPRCARLEGSSVDALP